MKGKVLFISALLVVGVGGTSVTAASASRSQGLRPTPAVAPANKQFTIYFAPEAIPNSFWAPMKNGAMAAGKITGDHVVWTQGATFDTADTVQRMQTAIATHPSALVVTDSVPAAFDPVMKQAQKDGIFVIDANAQSTSSNPPYSLYVGSDEYMAGQLAAKEVLMRGHPQRAACLIFDVTSVALESRCSGFTKIMSAAGIPVGKFLATGDPSAIFTSVQAYFRANPATGATYVTSVDPSVLTPTLQVLGSLSHKVLLVGSDNSTAAIQAIETGKMIGTIVQQQYLQGYLPVIYADLYLRYGFLPASPNVYTGPSFVDSSNVRQVATLVNEGIQG